MKFDLSKISNVVIADIDPKDYPDFCDAYIESADYDGKEMTEEELDEFEFQYPDFAQEQAYIKFTEG